MEKTNFIALADIGQPEKVRLLIYTSPQGAMMAHAPLPALVGAALRRDEGAGWRQYADGTLIQWGTGSGAMPLITFPRPFVKACWHVSLTHNEAIQADRLVVRHSLNVTRFSFTASGHFVAFQGGGGVAETGFNWMAWGE